MLGNVFSTVACTTRLNAPHLLSAVAYTEGMSTSIVGRCDSARDLAGTEPPTDDDVSITLDGRRLDTPDKVIAFIQEINAQRAIEDRCAG